MKVNIIDWIIAAVWTGWLFIMLARIERTVKQVGDQIESKFDAHAKQLDAYRKEDENKKILQETKGNKGWNRT